MNANKCLKAPGIHSTPGAFSFTIRQTTDILAFLILLKRQYRSSCIFGIRKKYVVAKDINISINTYSKYLRQSLEMGLCNADQRGNIQVLSYKDIFFALFGHAGYKMRVGKGGSFQQVKENIREQILLANFRQQQFIILGDSQFGSSKKPKTQKESKAKDWIKNKSSFRASSVSSIITSTRHAGRTIGLSAATAVKTLGSLLKKGLVQYEYPQAKFSLWGSADSRYAFAEQNRPFPGCSYSLLKEGVLFHIGRVVKIQ